MNKNTSFNQISAHAPINTHCILYGLFTCINIPDRVAQSVTCLATDASLTADPGVTSLIPARSYTFLEIDHEIISMIILLPSAVRIIQEGLLSVTSESMCTKY